MVPFAVPLAGAWSPAHLAAREAEKRGSWSGGHALKLRERGKGWISDTKEKKVRTDSAKYTLMTTWWARFKVRIFHLLRLLCQDRAPFGIEKGLAHKSVVPLASHPWPSSLSHLQTVVWPTLEK